MQAVNQDDRRAAAEFAGEYLVLVPGPREVRAAEMILGQHARLAQAMIDERGGARHARKRGERTEKAAETVAVPHLRGVGDDGEYLPEVMGLV